MAYTLEQLASDIKSTLKADPGPAGKEKVCGFVSKACRDDAFIASHLTAEQCKPRKVLFEDPETGFCICGHVYGDKAEGKPHDHGGSWAIYGQASGSTDMTEWKVVKKGEGATATLVEPARTYTMNQGDVRYYAPEAVHSPNRQQPTKLVRIEGKNLDHVQRSNIKAA